MYLKKINKRSNPLDHIKITIRKSDLERMKNLALPKEEVERLR